MKKKKIKSHKLIGLSAVILLLGTGIYYLVNCMHSDSNLLELNDTTEISEIETGIDTEWLEEQAVTEEEIAEKSAGHTIDDPYVKLNPYGTSPLAALVIFNTEEASQTTITVKGKTEDADITQTYDEYKTAHEIPVLGLYADYENTIEIMVTTESGKKATKTVTIQTDKLPESIGTISVEETLEDEVAVTNNELTFAVPSTKYAIGFDKNGDIRWYSTRYNSHIFQELKNGNILYLSKESNDGDSYNRLLEMDYIGKLYQVYTMSENAAISEQEGTSSTIVHHDAIELPSGNLLLTVNDGSQYIEDTMIEIDRKTGEIEKTIDLKNLFPEAVYSNYEPKENGDIDWFHQNSIVYDESDNSIIISGRHQDTVMKIDYETSEIVWILASHEDWSEEYEQYLLTPQGSDFKWNAAQHADVILSDSDKDENTIDILLYDNNKVITRGDESESEQYSAASVYRIDQSEMTVERIWTYGEERGKESYTSIVGSARYLEDSGHYLINFGHSDEGEISRIVETDENGDVTFEVVISDFPYGAWSYRAERYTLYPEQYEYKLSKSAE